MNDEVDFLEVGKRVPYKVPEAFFNTFSDGVFKRMERQGRRRRRLRIWGAAAAVLGVGILVAVLYNPMKGSVGFDNISQDPMELCIKQLSDRELDALVELYENDIFLTNN